MSGYGDPVEWAQNARAEGIEAGEATIVDLWARFLLAIGWGVDFASFERPAERGSPILPPMRVLVRLAEIMAADARMVGADGTPARLLERARFVLEGELGEIEWPE